MKRREKIYFVIILISFIATCISIIPFTRADSGWDGSYSSGGSSSSSSWGGGSSSSSWSSGSSSSSSSSYGGSSSSKYSSEDVLMVDLVFFILVFAFIIFLFVWDSKRPSPRSVLYDNQEYGDPRYTGDLKITAVSSDVNLIRALLPNFAETKFLNKAYDIYKKIQVAWMNFDYNTLREYTVDELYNLYYSQLIALKAKDQKNVMENFSLIDSRIVGIEHNDVTISLKVQMIIDCYDYVVDFHNNVVRGDKYKKVRYHYEMTFTRGLGEEYNYCPSCGGELKRQSSDTCPYCQATVYSTAHDWVLSKKRVIRQK